MTPVFTPVELSADSKRNAYYHQCAVLEGFQAFAVCLHKIDTHKTKTMNPIYEPCKSAISCKKCPAVGMRSDEVDAGKSIYFLERKQFQPVVNFLEKAKSLFNTKEPIAPAVAPVSKKPTVLPQDYMAQALTKAIAKQTGSE